MNYISNAKAAISHLDSNVLSLQQGISNSESFFLSIKESLDKQSELYEVNNQLTSNLLTSFNNINEPVASNMNTSQSTQQGLSRKEISQKEVVEQLNRIDSNLDQLVKISLNSRGQTISKKNPNWLKTLFFRKK